MVNENNETQLSLNTEAEPTAPAEAPVTEQTEAPSTEQTDVQSEPSQGGDAQATTETTTETQTTETSNYPGQETETPVDTSSLQKQLEDQQNRMAQLEQERNQNLVKQQAEQYRSQLINQGYTPEQAQINAEAQYKQHIQQMQTTEQYKQTLDFKEGQYRASLHYGKQFNIDPEQLLKYNTPQEMEQAAKHQSELRSLKEENAKLKKQQVPAQSFDNNTAPAEASSSEERLLDLYNSGVRNPDTNAAARRAAGVG